ncbi:MAG TPA: cyanophycinase [Pyrinomonadaceae bacterium]|nr:cyanophycinase [Pyrinomonadaceae bacterium]
MSKRKKAGRRAGRLVIIGGAEERDGEAEILREFVRLAGGARARVVIVSVASDAPAEVARLYESTFRRLGVSDVRALDIKGREDADGERASAAVREATGVFFTGGNQLRLTQLLGLTRLDTTLHHCHAGGLVIAGTSAGAAMMSSVMIVGSAPTMTLRAGMVELGSGLGFLPGVLIDQHFEQRGRLRRLLAAIAQHPHELGVGIDENTAAVVEGHTLEVHGRGSVTIIDAGGLTHTNLGEAERHELLAICGVRIHVLPAGYRFDLQKREPLL